MNILAFLRNHRCYFGVIHRREPDGKIVQTCYECGKVRPVKADLT